MNRWQPNSQNATPPQRPILRAAMMNVALCLLGLALYIQTNSVLFLIGGALVGAFVFFTALRKRHQMRGVKTAVPGNPQFRQQHAKTKPVSKTDTPKTKSNVTPFRRPASKKPDKKSNSPFG